MNILGIETSCDETAASVVRNGTILLSNVVVSQIDIHREFGGVVPEVAARSHIEVILPTVDKAIKDAQLTWDDIDAIAVTNGPGLLGSLLIGTLTAKTLAIVKDKPLYALNHVEGHTYANFITDTGNDKLPFSGSQLPSKQPGFPLLSLTVSGGHSQLILFRDHSDYELLGQTRDDAVGEAFDKVAKILGLGYPGGPAIAKTAETGDPNKYVLPTSRLDNPYDFSFSGLKTAVLRLAQKLIGQDYSFPSYKVAAELEPQQIRDIAASFQHTAVTTMVDNALKAFHEYSPKTVVIAGGVAANQELRRKLKEALPLDIEYAPPILCTDNAAMIAALGYYASREHRPVDPLALETLPSMSM